MSAVQSYLCGLATPLILVLIVSALCGLSDWRARRRYQRAWDKFSAEFDLLNPADLETYRAAWKAESYRFDQYCDDRSRYFSMKWQYGHTKEI